MKLIGKLLKFIFKTILWLVIIALLLGIVLYFSAGKLIQHFAPAAISQVTQTESSLGEVDISLFSGRVTLNNLTIGNPAGYKNKNALQLGKFDVKFDPRSVLTNKIIVNNVQISDLSVSSEAKVSGETNITRLLDNVNKSLNQGTKAAPAKETQKTTASSTTQKKAQKSVVIKDLLINDSSVNVALSGIPGLSDAAMAATVPLPDIHLQNIGEKKPQTLAETALQILNTINVEVVQASAKAVSDATKKAIQSGKDSFNAVKDTLKSLF